MGQLSSYMSSYVFTWSKLRKYLIDDEADPNSSNDFGKNIIPNMLNAVVQAAPDFLWKETISE